MPVNDESSPIFMTSSNPLIDCNNDFTSSDDESLFNKDVTMENFKIYSNPLFDDEEIISNKIDSYYFNAESNLIESLPNQDTLFDSLPNLMEKLLTINAFPRPLENFHDKTIIETLPTSPIPVEDCDSLREEIDIFTDTDDLMPLGIKSDEYDSKGDNHFLENESSNFDHHNDPSFLRPSPEPPDVEVFFDFDPNSGELISAVMNNIDELNKDECFDPEGGEIDDFANVKDDDYFPFIFVIQIFLPYLIYPKVSSLLLSTGSEDIIFDPVISI
nr:hypothetical protein [Tanacetum cinerariifolium]